MSFLNNKLVRFGLFGLGAIVLFAALLVVYSFFVNTAGFNTSSYSKQGFIASDYDGGYSNEMAMEESMVMAPSMGRAMLDGAADTAYYPEPVPPVPAPDGYTSGLERYETTSYNLSARSRDFDSLCDSLSTLKNEGAIHFKHLNTGLNHCDARFFVEEDRVASVLAQFENERSVQINRNTQSVTRHKEQIESQANIVRQQLASVERTLAEAEEAYDEIVAFARTNKDSETLNSAITNKLRQIDQLTSRKISLTSQLSNYAQQAADLNERLNVVEFYANFSRSNPVNVGENERRWEQAWEDLRDQFTETLIGVSVFFGIFILYVLQYGLYLLVLVVIARFAWKLVRNIWRW